jgi:WXG100 family type VII secretion target
MVHDTAVACQQGAETISGLLGALKNYILGLEGLWGGIAANTFQDMMAQYQADSIQITTALAEIGDKLMANYNNIITTEEANVRTVSSVQNSLPSTNFS